MWHPRVSNSVIEHALKKSDGIISVAAKRVGYTRSHLDKRIRKTPKLLKVLNESREVMTDDAERALNDCIRAKEPWAVKFYLATIGKNRGYVESQDVNVNHKVDEVKIKFVRAEATQPQQIPQQTSIPGNGQSVPGNGNGGGNGNKAISVDFRPIRVGGNEKG